MKFPYEKFPGPPIRSHPDRKGVLRPTIPVCLVNKQTGAETQYLALIDSGADYCICHASIGEVIGLDIRSGRVMDYWGIGGIKQQAYFHDIVLSVGGWKFDCYVGFSYDFDGGQMPYGVLGQDGFFDKFKVVLDRRKLEIEIKENPDIKFFPFKKAIQATS